MRLDGKLIEGTSTVPLAVTFAEDEDKLEDVGIDQIGEEFEEYFLEQLEFYGEGSIEADEALIPSEEEEEAQFLADEAMVFDEDKNEDKK